MGGRKFAPTTQDETRDRLVDVNYLVSKLADVYRPEGVEIWLHARNRALGGQRPIDMLAAREFQPVVRLVEQLASGAMKWVNVEP